MTDVALLAILHAVAIGAVGLRLYFTLRTLATFDVGLLDSLKRGFDGVATVSVVLDGVGDWIRLGTGSRLMTVYDVTSTGFTLTTSDGERVAVPAGTKLAFAGEARVDAAAIFAHRGSSLLATLVEIPASGDGPHRGSPRRYVIPEAILIVADPAKPLRSCARSMRWPRVAWLLAISATELGLAAADPRFNALGLFSGAGLLVLAIGGPTSMLNTILQTIFTRPSDPEMTVWLV